MRVGRKPQPESKIEIGSHRAIRRVSPQDLETGSMFRKANPFHEIKWISWMDSVKQNDRTMESRQICFGVHSRSASMQVHQISTCPCLVDHSTMCRPPLYTCDTRLESCYPVENIPGHFVWAGFDENPESSTHMCNVWRKLLATAGHK